jgi:hypothetical protein
MNKKNLSQLKDLIAAAVNVCGWVKILAIRKPLMAPAPSFKKAEEFSLIIAWKSYLLGYDAKPNQLIK